MHADVHVLWRGGEHPIGDGDVFVDQRAPVIAARRQRRLHLRIAEFGKSGLVDLDVTAAGFGKGVKLARECFHDIGPELIHIPVSARQYRSVSTAKVQCAGPRNRNFWPAIRMAFEETYVGGIDRTGPLHVATDNRNRLRTTAESHRRIMVVETMGRHAGWIACLSGMAVAADYILIPEVPVDLDHMCAVLKQ